MSDPILSHNTCITLACVGCYTANPAKMILQDPAGVLQVPARNDRILLQEESPARVLQDSGNLLQDFAGFLQNPARNDRILWQDLA